MTIRNRPNYQIYLLNLAVAGAQDIPCIGTRVVMVNALNGATLAWNQGGVPVLVGGTPTNAVVNVQVGKSLGDPIPFTVGTSIRVDNRFDFLRMSWSAQTGDYAVMLVSDDADGNGVSADAPPTVTIGSVTISQGGNTATVSGGGALNVAGLVELQGGGNAATVTNPALNSLPQSAAANAPQVQPGKAGGSFFANTALSGAATLVAAGSNVNGVVLRTASVGAGPTMICGGTTAPTTQTSNPNLLVGTNGAVLPREIFLQAGQGLYAFAGASSACHATYDIL